MRNIKPKQDEYMVGEGPGKLSKKKAEPVYPRMRLDLDTVPEAKKWEVGKSYQVEMELKMVGLSISRYDNSAEFEIRKIGGKDIGESEADADDEGEEDG
jgi:hypothetical protein